MEKINYIFIIVKEDKSFLPLNPRSGWYLAIHDWKTNHISDFFKIVNPEFYPDVYANLLLIYILLFPSCHQRPW